MKSMLRILDLEDEPNDAELIKYELEAEGLSCEVSRVFSEEDFASALDKGGFDLILADFYLPGFSGSSALAIARARRPEIPFIFVSGTMGEDVAVESLKNGATDYVLKQKLSRLVPAVRRALTEAEQRRAREKYEDKIREQAALLDRAQDAIVVCNLANRIQYWNKGAERLYGWSARETSGSELTEWLLRDADAVHAAQTVLLEKEEWQGELQRVTKDGRSVIVHSRWTLLRDTQVKPKSFLSIDTDITERKRLESQFLRNHRIESVGRLASGIAHDLNNILAPILASVPMLRTGLPEAEFDKTLATIETSAQRGADIVEQLLTYARGVEGERAIVQVRRLIHELAGIIEHTFPRNIAFAPQGTENLWPVNADATQLHQVFMNLCVNARDAMPQGGTLTVTAENLELDENYVSMNPVATVGPYVVIRVIDTGKGIPRELMDKVFDPFFSTKDLGKGSGLGLSTVLGIVKSHGGFLDLRSELGKGSTFEIYLPAIPNAQVQTSATQPPIRTRGRGELILVVDDESNICDVTKKTLEKSGYKVLTASDGIDAIAVYSQYRGKIDLVLTDIRMPILDGVALIRALKKLEPQIKVIASSGIASSGGRLERMAELEELGVRGFLSKPYTAEQMLATFDEALHKQ